MLSQAQDEASILYEASASGDPAVISLLLEYGADANVAKHTGHMPIHRVAHRGHLQYMFDCVLLVSHYLEVVLWCIVGNVGVFLELTTEFEASQ